MPGEEEQKAKAVSRREFLKGVGAAGAATALGGALLGEHPAQAQPTDDTEAAAHRGMVTLTLLVNGQKRAALVEPRTTLLNALRNHMEPAVTGPKLVCDRGACGACTVEVDGKTVYSCMMLAADAVGKRITTVEGLSPEGGPLSPVQAAFVKHDALMCGFCTPGFVMSVHNYLQKNPHATPDQVRFAVSGNLCRCGTYPKVFEAALAAAQAMQKGA